MERVAGVHKRLSVDSAVVEGVAGEDLAGLVGPACAESRIVIVQPRQRAAELVLRADEIDFSDVRHTGVEVGVESGIFRSVEPRRGGDFVKLLTTRTLLPLPCPGTPTLSVSDGKLLPPSL